jgi:L-ascorbate metabolism protein UlaG (beta-lactamase superfamily)
MDRRIHWLGHATVLLELGGARLLTDPVLGGRLLHLRRHVPAPVHPGELDAVLVSHVHHDHLDRGSLRAVASARTPVVVPKGAASLVADLGFGSVREVEAGETLVLGGAEIRAVRADHDGRRLPWTPELPTLGYVAGGVWFAGDTELFDAMAELRGQVDVALLPVWGWGSSLGPGHLDPEEAARAAALVAPELAIPIHWGTFFPIGLGRRHPHLLTDPPHRFAAQVASLAPTVSVRVLAPGESVSA